MEDTFRIQLRLQRQPGSDMGRYEAALSCPGMSQLGRISGGDIWLRPDDEVTGLDMSLSQFRESFLRGDMSGLHDALAFGRWLYSRLFQPPSRLQALWEDARREQGERPMRFELVLPQATDDGGLAEDLPFELLAEQGDLLFRRPGWLLVRCYDKHTPKRFEVRPGARALLAWANPELEEIGKLKQSVFSEHERVFQEQGRALGLQLKPVCQEATFASFKQAVGNKAAGDETTLLSLVAHGFQGGGELVLHSEQERRLPATVTARDFAQACRDGGVQVALLWSCHGAQRNLLRGAVAEALLNPTHGNLAAVVSAHAALQAAHTPHLAEALLDSFSGTERDLERAVARARKRLKEDDLQWAAPVYYARPEEGRSVIYASDPALQPQLSVATGGVEKSPRRPAWYVGREQEVADGLELLRRHRLVTVAGMPGIGKSEVVREVSQRAAENKTFGFQRALWLPADECKLELLRSQIGLLFNPAFDPTRCVSDLQLAREIGDTSLLLVIDNAEDYLDSGEHTRIFTGLLKTLLEGCRHLRILLGSRRDLGGTLGSHVEKTLSVPRLPMEDAQSLFLAVASKPASELEVDPDLRAIIQLLDGHPRSLVLVAGQIGRGRPTAKLRAQLEAEQVEKVVVDELLGQRVPSEDDRALRAQRLISSLNLAYGYLRERRPEAADMFAWLGVLPAGLPRELTGAIFGEDADTHLAALLREHLADDSDPRRITLPAPLRWYASRQMEELPAKQRDDFLSRTLSAFAEWLMAAREAVGTPRASAAFQRALIEAGNVDALSRRLTADAPREACGRLFSTWAYMMQHADAFNTAIPLLEKVHNQLSNKQDWALANTLKALGDLYTRTDRLQQAESSYSQALSLFRQVEARLGEANTLRRREKISCPFLITVLSYLHGKDRGRDTSSI